MSDMNGNTCKQRKGIKKKQTEMLQMKSSVTEIKMTQSFNTRIDQMMQRISDLDEMFK